MLGLTHNYWQIIEGIGTVNVKNAKFNRNSDIQLLCMRKTIPT